MNHRISAAAAGLMAMAMMLAGCGHRKADIAEPTKPMPNWKWQVPSPVVPDMAWVPAGPYRIADRTPETVDAIVIHTTEGRYNEEQSFEENQNRAFVGNINYFKGNDRNVSAHYVMGPNGEICQMVNETDIAHTQTYYNGRGFGIECAGWGRFPEQWTPEMMDSLVNLCAYLCVKWEIPAYQPEGTAYEGPWSVTLDGDTKRFVAPGIVGHYQVQPWNKSDPGPHFPWEEFTERVRAKIREYGVEPIPLPDPAEEVAKVSYVDAKIVEEDLKVGQPFTYRLVIVAKGAGALKASNITFPDLSVVPHVKQAGEPKVVEQAENRIVFEVPMRLEKEESINFTASRVNLNGNWLDSGTVSRRLPRRQATQ